MPEMTLGDRQAILTQISGLTVNIRREKGVNVFEFFHNGKSVKTAFTYPKAKLFAEGVRFGRSVS